MSELHVYGAILSGILYKEFNLLSQYTPKPLCNCVYQENRSDKWDFPCYIARKCCITTVHGQYFIPFNRKQDP